MNKSPKYWVACSGGVDSVVLLHLMHEQKKNVGILHCNFHLREESSNEDEAFVRKLAEELGVPIRVREFNTTQYGIDNRMNTQLAARELRYVWFEEVIQEENGIVLLAHHYDDQLETFFLQLRRGGKVKGLSGMPLFKDGYLRPILNNTKEELVALAKKHNWKWQEDVTNSSNDYTRNWYRNEVLPWLKKTDFPLEEVVPLMHSFQQLLAYLRTLETPSVVRIEDWLAFPIWYKDYILSEQVMGEFAESEINRLAKAEKGKFIGNKVTKVWNESETFVFVKEDSVGTMSQLEIATQSIGDVHFNSTDLCLDAAKVAGELSTRKWRAGDYFQPLGMIGEKSMGKFLRDRKVPAHQKEKVLVLISAKGFIVGVFGFGVGDRFKVDSNTKEVICARLVEA